MECQINEIYDIRKECPKTCIDKFGQNDCGELKFIEGCYCKEGFVKNSLGECIDLKECGCLSPDGSIEIQVYFF